MFFLLESGSVDDQHFKQSIIFRVYKPFKKTKTGNATETESIVLI